MCWGEGSRRAAQPSRLSLLTHISPAPRPPASQRYFYRGYKSPIQPASPSFSAREPEGEGEAAHLPAASVSAEPGEVLQLGTPGPGSCPPRREQGAGHGGPAGGTPGASAGSPKEPPSGKGTGLGDAVPAVPFP